MTDVVIALPRFREAAGKVASLIGADMVEYSETAFRDAFASARRIVAVMSSGIAVREIAPFLKDKWSDPAVVVVSPDLAVAIPLVGGHHGANELARQLADLGAVPVITTATERAGKDAAEVVARACQARVLNRDATRVVNAALLDGDVGVYTVNGPAMVIAGPGVAVMVREGEYSVGIGCRRGEPAASIGAAIQEALRLARVRPDEVSVYATTDKKSHETGIIEAVRGMGGALVLVDERTLQAFPPSNPSRAGALGLAGVAEPCALAASWKRELVLPKTAFPGVTVAIAR
jgi:cobalt-precorrin 5A hydrolase